MSFETGDGWRRWLPELNAAIDPPIFARQSALQRSARIPGGLARLRIPRSSFEFLGTRLFFLRYRF